MVRQGPESTVSVITPSRAGDIVMSDIPIAAPPAPEADILADDTPCRSCGYNLRGRRTDTVCSECGTPVMNSLGSNQLQFANPAWLAKIGLGVRIYAWAMAIGFAAGLTLGL